MFAEIGPGNEASLEPRLSVPDFVSQLWRKAARQNLEWKAWLLQVMLRMLTMKLKAVYDMSNYSSEFAL